MVLGLLLPWSELSPNPVRSSIDLCPGRVTNSFLWLQNPNSLSSKRECCPLLLCKAAGQCWKWRNLTTSWAPDKQYPMLASHYKHCDVHCRTLRPQTPPPAVSSTQLLRKDGEWTHWCLMSLDIYCNELFKEKYGWLCYLALRNQRHTQACPSLTFLPYKLDRMFHFRQVPPTQRSLQGPEEKKQQSKFKTSSKALSSLKANAQNKQLNHLNLRKGSF